MSFRIDRRAYLAALCRTVPQCIVQRVLAEPSDAATTSEEGPGTVLFADLVGFASLNRDLSRAGSAELSLLSDVLEKVFTGLLDDCFFPHRGEVLHFGGDSITVAFRGEDAARRAVTAAAAATELIDSLTGERMSSLRLRVGLGSGIARFIVVGDELQRLVVAGGSASRAAMRAHETAEPGSVVMDAMTAELVDDAVTTEEHEGKHRRLRAIARPTRAMGIEPFELGADGELEKKIVLLEPFVPAPLAARLRTVPAGWRIEGELRTVVVVFNEAEGITRENQELGFSAARLALRAHRRYGGVQFKFDLTGRGHRNLSLFGLHAPTDNDPERAVLAGLEMMAELKSVLAVDPKVVLRCGIHVGEVYFGAIGSEDRHDITVIGDVVQLAARAADAAEPFGIVGTHKIIECLSPDYLYDSVDPIRFKGQAEPIQFFSIHGTMGRKARYVQRRLKERELAGRDDELATIEDVIREARAGSAQIVSIVGAHGTGKSALLGRLVDRWLDLGGLGLIGVCDFAHRSEPLASVRAMFTGFVGLTDDDPNPRATVERSLAGYDLGPNGDALLDFIAGIEPETSESSPPEDIHWQQVLSAIERFVHQRVTELPVLYILEDVHNADSLTLRLVKRLARLPRNSSFLFVATSRDVPAIEALSEVWDAKIQLDDLSLRAAARLVSNQFSATIVDDDVAAFMWERTGGNPGRLTELTRFLRDRGLLVNRGGTVGGPDAGMTLLEELVPSDLAQFALGRLDHLSEIERRLIRVAATIGRSFDREVLMQAVARLSPEHVDAGVVSLIDEGVIAPEASKRPAYRFRDELTRAVTYAAVPEAERREFHRRIADVLEGMSDTDVERSAVTLARHRERAGQFAKAAAWYERAIRVVVFAGLDEETMFLLAQWERVVEMLEESEKPRPRELANMMVRKLVATSRHGFAHRALEIFREIGEHHREELAASERAIVDLWGGVAQLRVGERIEARRVLRSAFDNSPDSTVRCNAAIYLFNAYPGIVSEREWWLDRAKEEAKPGTSQALRVELSRAAHLADDLGKLDEARIINARIRDDARRKDQLIIAAIAANNLADCDLESGDVEEALAGFEESMVLARALGTRNDDAIHRLNVGICHVFLGNYDRAVSALEAALGIVTEVGGSAIEAEAKVHLGLALAITDDIERGAALVAEGQAALSPGTFGAVAAALHQLRIALLTEDPARISEHAEPVRALDRDSLSPLLRRLRSRLLARAAEAGA